MGTDAADFAGDGLLDIIVTNFARDRCTLYRNVGDLFFDDVTTRHEIGQASYMSLSWGCAFFDFDLDADVDLVIVNGHIYPQVDHHPDLDESYRQRPILFENVFGRFVDVSRTAGPGLRQPAAARGLAVADYDNDGDPDLVVSVMDGPPLLLRNDTPRTGHWVRLRVLNRRGADAVGARVLVTAGGVTQVRELRSGSTYQSQDAMHQHLGLGAATQIDSIEVSWPGGSRSVVRDQAADRLITITQP
jgi:hypothetical protein